MKYLNLNKALKILQTIGNRIGIFTFFCFCLIVVFLSDSNLLFASGDVKYADDIYRLAEDNGIAQSICKAIDIGTILMITITIMGATIHQMM